MAVGFCAAKKGAKDREEVETAVKKAVNHILEEDITQALKEACEAMKEGRFMEIRRSEYNLYWSQQAITDKKNKQKKQEIDDQLASPARSSKRLRLQKSIIVEEKDEVLEQSLNSVSSTIETNALSVYMGRKYKQLDSNEENIVSNGLNSILDLSNEIKQGQRSLFTKEEWKQVQAKHNKDKELKKIEKLAVDDAKAAYKESLRMQGVYALTDKERYFTCYSHMLKVIIKSPSILTADNDTKKEYTEEDYVVKIWSPLLEAFFEDPQLILKWGESVAAGSSSMKKQNTESKSHVIGDKIDLRVISSFGWDVVNFEFASHAGNTKYLNGHRKVLREAKNIGDTVYKSQFVNKKKKETVNARCIQIAAMEGEVIEVTLVDSSLYVAEKIGALRVPSGALDLKVLRTTLERLEEIKRGAIYLAQLHAIIKKKEVAEVRSLDGKRDRESSPFSNKDKEQQERKVKDEKFKNWTRGSWFPPSDAKDTPFAGDLPAFFLSTLPSSTSKN